MMSNNLSLSSVFLYIYCSTRSEQMCYVVPQKQRNCGTTKVFASDTEYVYLHTICPLFYDLPIPSSANPRILETEGLCCACYLFVYLAHGQSQEISMGCKFPPVRISRLGRTEYQCESAHKAAFDFRFPNKF